MKRLALIGLIIAMLFAIGCNKGGGSNTPPTPSNTATGIIGANGGVIFSADGKATIQIPAGALTADTTISVTTVTENLGQIGSMYQVTAKETAELVFSMPVTLKFNYDPSLLSAGAIEQDSKLAFLGAYDSWEIFPDSAVDTVNHVITATTTHFSNVGWIQSFPDGLAPKLGFPLAPPSNPYNTDITSVFDHSMTMTHCPNSIVTAFTGEQGTLVDLNESSLPALNCPGQRLYSYKKDSAGTPFTINGNYVGTSSPGTLNYDGHAGYDYPVAYVDVFAAASGTVRVWKESTCWNADNTAKNVSGCWGRIDILHDNVYETRYIHMSRKLVTTGQFVNKGDKIGVSGETGAVGHPHLHFEVRKNDKDPAPIDPYGWTGTPDADPYSPKLGGIDSMKLWDTSDPGGIGDISFSLIWSWSNSSRVSGPDIDLWVEDPLGQTLSSSRDGYGLGPTPEGGIIDYDDQGGNDPCMGNPWCDGGGPERAYWPNGQSLSGTYIYGVRYFAGDGTVDYTINVYKNSSLISTRTGALISPGEKITVDTITK